MNKAESESVDATTREALFDEMTRQHGGALTRLCAGYELDTERRRELRQEVLLQLWRSLPSFSGRSSLRTWMYRVAHNVAVTHAGHSSRQPHGNDVGVDVPARGVPADSQVDRAAGITRLRRVIADLAPVDRQVILLYLEELPHAEIAEITGMTRGNVSTRVHRIKRTLVKKVQEARRGKR